MGDDDTLWQLAGVYRLLQGYDHTLPYYISDMVVEMQELESLGAPRIHVGAMHVRV
ncbi:hypothetical protein FOA52_013168 [Chlamydomonas sp. UWO 241]|nr:hypothetical protein FOA52_013168 [Chlamydomonas sp. UWO 241]